MAQLAAVRPGSDQDRAADPPADARGPLVVVQAGSKMLTGQVNRILTEELNHALQMEVPKGQFGIPLKFLDSELDKRAVQAPAQAGNDAPDPRSLFYERNRAIMAAEVSVRLMHPALYPELGLSPEEAVAFAAQHAEALVAKHGNRAAAVKSMTPSNPSGPKQLTPEQIEESRRNSLGAIAALQKGGPQGLRQFLKKKLAGKPQEPETK